MRACEEQGQGIQVDSSVSYVCTPESIVEHVEHEPIIDKSQHKLADDVVSQDMIRVL